MTTTTLPSQGDLKGVYFYFARIAEPQQKWQTTGDTEKEYTISVVVSSAQFKEFCATFPKKKTAPIPNDEFEEKYKTKPPFPDQPLQYVLKFKQRAFKQDGTPIADSLRPKTFRFVDRVQEDITSTLIGNGSKGTLRYTTWVPTKNPTLGPTANLSCVLVTNLVAFTKQDPNAFNPEEE